MIRRVRLRIALRRLLDAECHVSTRGALEAIRVAKNEGSQVTCEVTPHHWTLTDEAVSEYDTNTKMSPPLRSQDHVDAILEAIKDGTIDAIATDHGPKVVIDPLLPQLSRTNA